MPILKTERFYKKGLKNFEHSIPMLNFWYRNLGTENLDRDWKHYSLKSAWFFPFNNDFLLYFLQNFWLNDFKNQALKNCCSTLEFLPKKFPKFPSHVSIKIRIEKSLQEQKIPSKKITKKSTNNLLGKIIKIIAALKQKKRQKKMENWLGSNELTTFREEIIFFSVVAWRFISISFPPPITFKIT